MRPPFHLPTVSLTSRRTEHPTRQRPTPNANVVCFDRLAFRIIPTSLNRRMTRSPDAPLVFEPARSLPSPGYAEHFGFARAPFDSISDTRFIYPGRAYASIQAEILEALKRREGLVVLTGGSGTGKTTMYRSLLHALPPPTYVSEVVDPFLTPEDLLKQILIDLGVLPSEAVGTDTNAGATYHDLILMVRRFLEGLLSTSARVIVVIDDAHQLQPRVLGQLRALANIQTSAGKGPQILLVGQPALDGLLEHPDVRQLNERVVRRCHLPPLTRDDVLPYIQHRLAASMDAPRTSGAEPLAHGGRDQLALAAPANVSIGRAALRRLISLSGGIPRTLNLLCDRALEVAFEQLTHEISPAVVRESAKRVGLRPSPVDRLHTRTAALPLAISVLAILVAGLWAVKPLLTRTRVPAAPIPAPSEPVQSTSPATAGQAQNVEPLQTADSFAIVVASFKSRERAHDTVTTITQLGLPAFAREDGGWHVVLVGPYVTSIEAGDALTQIPHRAFPDAHILKEAVVQTSAQ